MFAEDMYSAFLTLVLLSAYRNGHSGIWNEMQKGDGMFKLLFPEEQSDYCTDGKWHKIIAAKKERTGYDTTYSFMISENRRKNT